MSIKVGTDPAYPPQSELKPDGTFEGFDIDTANEIAQATRRHGQVRDA